MTVLFGHTVVMSKFGSFFIIPAVKLKAQKSSVFVVGIRQSRKTMVVAPWISLW